MLRSAGVHEPQRRCWLSTQRTLAGSASPSRCAADSAARPGHQLAVAAERPAAALLAGLQLGDHLRHPAALLGRAERGRDEDDGAALLAVGGDRAPAPGAAPDLDDIADGVAVGGRGGVGSRSGHAGTVSHGGDRAPARTHPCGYRSHGRWTWRALSPVTRVALRSRPQAAVRTSVQVGRPVGPSASPLGPGAVPGPHTGTRRAVPTRSTALSTGCGNSGVRAGLVRRPARRSVTGRHG